MNHTSRGETVSIFRIETATESKSLRPYGKSAPQFVSITMLHRRDLSHFMSQMITVTARALGNM